MPRTSRIHARRPSPHAPTASRPATRIRAAANRDPAPAPDGKRKPERGPSRPQKAPDEGFVAVGRVLAPFGLRGELKVQALTDNPRRFAPRSRLWAGQQLVTIVSSRTAQGYVYVTLKGFKHRTSVEHFRHALLQVPEASLPPLEDGEYYRFQLIGLRVIDRAGNELGTLDEIIETGANDVYRVHTREGADLLLPARADVILHVDVNAREMTVDPPEWR